MPKALVGRDTEIELLEQALDDVRAGLARVVLIEGEAGIGKSALVEHIAERAAATGLSVQLGRCVELAQSRPFGVLVDAFGERRLEEVLGPGLSQAVGLASSSDFAPTDGHLLARAIDRFVDLIEAKTCVAPVLLILEDVHWADHASVLAIAQIVRHTMDIPILLLLTSRPSIREDVRSLARELTESRASRTTLGALADAAVHELAQTMLNASPGPRLKRWLAGAGGNPLYVTELLASLEEDQTFTRHDAVADIDADVIPPALGPAILKRISFVSLQVLDILRMAAVLGTSFGLRDLSGMTGCTFTELHPRLSEAKNHGLVETDGDGFRFRHALIRDALYHDMDLPTRRALHRHAATVIRERGAHLDQIAEHVSIGAQAPDVEAAGWLHRAGIDLIGLSPDVTVKWLRIALDLLPAKDPGRASIYVDLGRALFATGEYSEALRSFCDALAHGPPVGRELEAHAQICLLIIYSTPASLELEEQVVIEALAIPGPERIRIKLLCELALIHRRLDARDRMEQTFRQARTLAATLQDLDVSAAIELAEAWARVHEWPAVDRLREQVELAQAATRAVGDVDTSLSAQMAMMTHIASSAWLAFAIDDFERCDEALRYARQGVRQMSLSMGYLRIEPPLRFIVGEWDDAIVGFEALAAALGWRRLETFSALTYLALHLHRGDDKATLGATGMLAHAVPEWPHGGWVAALLRGDIQSVLSGASVLRAGYAGAAATRMLLRDVIRMGHGPSAVEQLEGLLPRAIPDALPSYEGARLHLNGLLRDDVEMLARSAEVLTSTPHVTQLALAREDLGAALARRGKLEDAEEPLTAALQAYRAMGARRDEASATSILRAHKIKVPRRRSGPAVRAGLLGLSEAQERVALLVAGGLSNREIADRLYLSRFTVETHLKHIFAKCGVGSRAELAALVARVDEPRVVRNT